MTPPGKRPIWILIAIVLIAALLRGWAVLRLPADFDEPIYLQAGFDYAAAIRAGDLSRLVDYAGNREHPALVKIFYGLVVAALGEKPDWLVAGLAGRALSAAFGTLAVLAMSLYSPVAGVLLAVHTMTIKYTSQVYLEALPLLASLVAVIAFSRVTTGRGRWFWLSAVALGVTAASKFTFLPVALVILYLAICEKRLRWHNLALYGATALAVFWLLNPTLWRDPAGRLLDALVFHAGYSRGQHVQQVGYPWYQPLVWISRSAPSLWHPEVFFYPALDGVICLFAFAGLYWEWRERRWVVVWVVMGLLFLLVWPTKWPQYTLVLVPALCLSAASAASHAFRWVRDQETYWAWLKAMVPSPPRAFWVLLGGLVMVVAVGYTAASVQLTMGRLGWSRLTAQNSFLPSNLVYAVTTGDENQIVLGTDRGAVLWPLEQTAEATGDVVVLTTQNSGLPGNQVLAVMRDRAGFLWFGTVSGLARYDGNGWQTYRGADMGLTAEAVYALAEGSAGQIWVATGGGAALFDSQRWSSFTSDSSGLVDSRVLSVAVQAGPGGDQVWLGSEKGISRLDAATGEWLTFTADELGLPWGGILDLMVDSAGEVWCGTVGGGLGRWDGSAWAFYRTANSDIPFNTVNVVGEVEPGVLWVGTALPNAAGGVLAEFDGESWRVLDSHNSGYPEAEALTIATDAGGRRWIGTRTAGVAIYQPRQ